MESALTWEYMSLVNELTQGMERANQLRLHLSSTSPSEAHHLLLQRILSSYEKALMILKWKGSEREAASAVLEGSVSVDGSPKSDDLNKNFKDHHQEFGAVKKRKLQPTWTEQVRVNSDNGLEGPIDDGYSWRKYGQKDILGAKYPRSYYRCTYRMVQNCWATKQVQRSDEDPTVFDLTYKGTHTCNQSTTAVAVPPPPASPEKKESKLQNQTLMNLKANLKVSTDNLDDKGAPSSFSFSSTNACRDNTANQYFPLTSLPYDNHLGAYSPLFLSPATPESNYLSTATHQLKSLGGTQNYQHSESDVAEIISANASTSNSPIGGMEFPLDRLELDPSFPFDTEGFFT
ncbi:probable WRKY transcription factor 53 [Andrographis paniculata]|uniref:probable WRKY transcription factor 53 n=1 Tax=Andrographis paniculata TaxID=175694 RepID=UPI0021E7382E|nr:probable WRKY transcription factor 53 [Andrographis paniculata]